MMRRLVGLLTPQASAKTQSEAAVFYVELQTCYQALTLLLTPPMQKSAMPTLYAKLFTPRHKLTLRLNETAEISIWR